MIVMGLSRLGRPSVTGSAAAGAGAETGAVIAAVAGAIEVGTGASLNVAAGACEVEASAAVASGTGAVAPLFTKRWSFRAARLAFSFAFFPWGVAAISVETSVADSAPRTGRLGAMKAASAIVIINFRVIPFYRV